MARPPAPPSLWKKTASDTISPVSGITKVSGVAVDSHTPTTQTVTVSGATTAVTLGKIGNVLQVAMGASTTLTVTGAGGAVESCILKCTQDGVGSKTLAITGGKGPASGGTTVPLSTTAGSIDFVQLFTDDSWTTVYWTVAGKAFA